MGFAASWTDPGMDRAEASNVGRGRCSWRRGRCTGAEKEE